MKKIIELQTEANPKRKGSRAYKCFSILMKFNGKAVDDFFAEEGRHPSLDTHHGWAVLELWYAVRLGLVKLRRQIKSAAA